jgi:CMP-N,N'-diacetyllegionaminic acid synthase
MTRTLALVPARAGSKRVPHKNIRLFNGRPLVQWTLQFALAYPAFDRVLVSTDSVEVAAIAESLGLRVPWMRPAPLASDHATTIEVALHALDRLAIEGEEFDQVALLQPTCPVRLTQRWDEAFKVMDGGATATVGVSMVEDHPFWTFLLSNDLTMTPVFPDKVLTRSQDRPPVASVNGALYLSRCDSLRQWRSFIPPGSRAVVCTQPVERIDIDTETDWVQAEALVASSWAI